MLFEKLWYQAKDELIGVGLLYFLLRHRLHHPFKGETHKSFPDLFCGELDRFCQPTPIPVDLNERRSLYFENDDYRIEDVYFPSRVKSAIPSNDTVILRHWIPTVENKSNLTVIGCDGLGQMGSGWFWRFAKQFAPAGIEVVMMDAPYNYRRTPKGYKTGQLVVGGDLDHQLSVSRQSILDLWTTIISLQQQGRRVGLTGISFGGWLCLMGGLVAEDLEFIYALAPPVDLGTISIEGGAVTRAIRRGLGYHKLDHKLMMQAARAVTARFWEPKLDPQKITLFGGEYDRFIPTFRVQELAKVWNCNYEHFADGHIGLASDKKYIELIAQRIIAQEQATPSVQQPLAAVV